MWVNNPFFFKLFVCGGRGGGRKAQAKKNSSSSGGVPLAWAHNHKCIFHIEISVGYIKT